MVDNMSFGMELVGSLSVFDVLFVLVVMNGACVLLVRWPGNVGLCRLVDGSVAVWWQCWLVLVFGGLLFELVLVSLMVSVGLCKSECRSVDVRWRWRLSWVMLALVVGGELFRLTMVVVD